MKRYFHLAGILFTAAALFGQDPNQAPNIDPNQPPAQDPPARVARLSLLQGQVSFQPASVNEWTGATINYPITIGDHLYADVDSRAELQVGSTAIRLGATSALGFLNLDDRVVQMRLDQGGLIVRVLSLEPDEVYEIDTAQGAVTLLQPGEYRIDTDPDRDATMVTVRSGNVSVNTNNGTFAVNPRQTAYFTGDGQPQFASANPFDALDQFSMDQDRAREQMPAPRYVSQDMPGWQDLERNGQWTDDREYGPVWRPRTVSADWAPYRYGHWAWVEPWGWTWIDDAPWGFAPFHYGRWVMVGGSWAWVPGRVERRPVYAPALVAFVGGGAIAGVAWFPLGPREVFVPAYRVSPVYVNRVNVTTVNVTNITVINRTYVNRTYVTAVDHRSFASAQPVHRAMLAVPRDVAVRAQVTVAAPVAPQRISVMGRASAPVNVPRPRAQVINRPVYAQRTPPPAPVPFAARQQALQANPGRPVDRTTIEQIRSTSAPVRQPPVRTLPPSNQTSSPQGTQFGRPRTNTPTTPPPALPDQPQQRQRNSPEIATPPTAGGAPPPPPNTPADRVERQQRMQRVQPPEVAPATPAPARTPEQTQPQPRQRTRPEPGVVNPAPSQPTEQTQPQPRQRTRPEPAATTPPPAARQERPAAREEKPAPKRDTRKTEEKKEEK